VKISPKTRPIGLIGHPVEHSLSPKLHNSLYEYYGLDYVYLAFDVNTEDLKRVVDAFKVLGFRGFNVTIPHKQSILPYLDEIDPEAEAIGAVNTVKIEDGRLLGYNTDGSGFVDSLKQKGCDPAGKKAALLGAGGSARSISFYLVKEGLDLLLLVNRSRDRAQKLAEDLNRHFGKVPVEVIDFKQLAGREVDIIINTTPVGMWPKVDASPLEGFVFSSGSWVVDIIYNPLETKLLADARRAGCQTSNGMDMLIGQAIRAVEIWTGLRPSFEICSRIL